MCGIFCVIKKRGILNREKCIKSLRKLNHRGPDWSFYKIYNENVFLGQTVLSMTGLSKKNINNNFSDSKNSFILFNGEIYNYKELNLLLKRKQNLEKPDTKILINLIEEKNFKNYHNYLDGMYAYITYSSINNELTVFRDPQGEKILYYHENNNEIIFSSEINTIIYYLNGNVKIDYDILSSYFLTRHFSIIDKTVFKNINILKPGHEIKISLNSFRIKQKEILNLRDLIDKNIYSS